jgi:23S rRNA (uracil1939-C5)-methyltransferase
MKKAGSQFEVRIERVDEAANGVARVDGLDLLVGGAVPGDCLKVIVEQQSRHHDVAWCKIEEVQKRGADFVEPVCRHAAPLNGRCGGCPAMHLSDRAYAAMKVSSLRTALKKEGIEIEPTWHAAPSRVDYRNRSNYIPKNTKRRRVLLGSYIPRSNQVAWMEGCHIVRPPIREIAYKIEVILSDLKIPLHPEPEGLRSLTIRASNSGEVLVDMVTNSDEPKWLTIVAAEMMAINKVDGVSVSVNASDGNAMRMGSSTCLRGRKTVIEQIGSLQVEMAAASFAQLNSAVAKTMYQCAASWFEDLEVIWDLYCGLGGLGLSVAQQLEGARLFGADVVEESIVLARKNAERANLQAVFETVDLAEAMSLEWPLPDLILVNPPRRGLDVKVRENLSGFDARCIGYMSCNPASFSRDARGLIDGGYRLEMLNAYDMLPQTTHVELLGKFTKFD